MPKSSGFGRAKSLELDEACEFINSSMGFYWNSATRHWTTRILTDNGQPSRADFAYFASIRSSYVYCRCKDTFIKEHYCPHRFSRQFGFHQDIPTDIDFSILPSSRIILRPHQACVRYGTNSQAMSLCQCLEKSSLSTSKSGGPTYSPLHYVPNLDITQRGRETVQLTKIFKGKKVLLVQGLS